MAKSTRSSRSAAARKANATRAVRREFIEEFGQRAFDALVRIAKVNAGRRVPSSVARMSPTSLAAYRANLTRGTYGAYVAVNADGTWDDDMNLVNV